jgi:drug/metabolite transporter (DMT)-like permease
MRFNVTEMKPLFLLVFLGSSWGLYFSLLKLALQTGVSYLSIATIITASVCLGMVLISALRRRFPTWTKSNVVFYAVCALLGYLFPMLIELTVIENMPVSVLTLIVSVSPLATLVFAWIMKTDVINGRKVLGILIGAVAIFAILLPDAHASNAVEWRWLFLAALVPVCYALYHNIIARYWPVGADSWQIACGESVLATFMLIGFSVMNWQGESFEGWNSGYTAILVMSVIALVDIYIYFEVVRLRGPIFVSHANYFMVVSGVIWGIVFFSETPSSLLWVSAGFLLISLFLIADKKQFKSVETVS